MELRAGVAAMHDCGFSTLFGHRCDPAILLDGGRFLETGAIGAKQGDHAGGEVGAGTG